MLRRLSSSFHSSVSHAERRGPRGWPSPRRPPGATSHRTRTGTCGSARSLPPRCSEGGGKSSHDPQASPWWAFRLLVAVFLRTESGNWPVQLGPAWKSDRVQGPTWKLGRAPGQTRYNMKTGPGSGSGSRWLRNRARSGLTRVWLKLHWVCCEASGK